MALINRLREFMSPLPSITLFTPMIELLQYIKIMFTGQQWLRIVVALGSRFG